MTIEYRVSKIQHYFGQGIVRAHRRVPPPLPLHRDGSVTVGRSDYKGHRCRSSVYCGTLPQRTSITGQITTTVYTAVWLQDPA